MAWLVHNVPVTFWVWFAGLLIGAIVIGITVGQTTLVKELFKKSEPMQLPQLSSQDTKSTTKDGPTSDSATKSEGAVPNPLRMSEPTPMQIIEAINNAPPLQQKDLMRHYEGIRVEWELFLEYGLPMGKDSVLVLFEPSEHFSLIAVRCLVKLPLYRDLGIMKRGRRIRVVGTIYEVDNLFITLKDVQLTY